VRGGLGRIVGVVGSSCIGGGVDGLGNSQGSKTVVWGLGSVLSGLPVSNQLDWVGFLEDVAIEVTRVREVTGVFDTKKDWRSGGGGGVGKVTCHY